MKTFFVICVLLTIAAIAAMIGIAWLIKKDKADNDKTFYEPPQ